MAKRITVTGRFGFVGQKLADALLRKGDLVLPDPDQRPDFCDREQVMSLPPADTIIHLAAKSYVPDSFQRPADFYHNNIVSSKFDSGKPFVFLKINCFYLKFWVIYQNEVVF